MRVPREQTYRDDDLLAALRRAADDAGSPMSAARYARLSDELRLPNWLTIVHRFGTWNAACAAAGLAVHEQPGRSSRWDRTSAVVPMQRFMLDAEPLSKSYSAYTSWAKGREDVPSGQTIRNIFGTWSAAKEAATRPQT